MFYFAPAKKSNSTNEYIRIEEDTLKDAKEYVESWCRISCPRKKSSNYKIITEAEYKVLLKKELEIDKVAKFIYKKVIKFGHLNTYVITVFDLKGDTSKPYYIKFWSSGKFVDLKELKEIYLNVNNRGECISAVYDVKTGKQLKISPKYEVKLFLGGKELL